MADKKISQLPAATTPLAGTEVLPIVQSSTTDQVSVANLTAGRAVSAASLTLTSSPLPIASGGTNQTAYTAPSGNVKGLVYFDGTKLANDTTVTDVGYDTSTNTVNAKNFTMTGQYSQTGYAASDWLASWSNSGASGHSMLFGYNNGTNNRIGLYISGGPAATNQLDLTVVNKFGVYGSGGVVVGTGDPGAGNLALSTGNLIISTSGKGIDFSATPQPAGMTSELLSDYEEGTWTPSVGGNATYNATYTTGTYTKVGRLVTVVGELYITTIGSGSTGIISGLPYAANGSHPTDNPGSVGYYANLTPTMTWVTCVATGSTVYLLGNGTAGGTTIAYNASGILKDSSRVQFSATYFV